MFSGKKYVEEIWLRALNYFDFDRSLEFCHWIMGMIKENPQFLFRILWTDEDSFNSDGGVHLHNVHFLSAANWLRLLGVCKECIAFMYENTQMRQNQGQWIRRNKKNWPRKVISFQSRFFIFNKDLFIQSWLTTKEDMKIRMSKVIQSLPTEEVETDVFNNRSFSTAQFI